jgi:hypothetical protein
MTSLAEVRRGRNVSNPSAVQDLNRELARRLIEEARDDPQSPYAGKFVGTSPTAASSPWRTTGMNWPGGCARPNRTRASRSAWRWGADYDTVQEIWGPR